MAVLRLSTVPGVSVTRGWQGDALRDVRQGLPSALSASGRRQHTQIRLEVQGTQQIAASFICTLESLLQFYIPSIKIKTVPLSIC